MVVTWVGILDACTIRRPKPLLHLTTTLQQTWQEQDNWMDYYRHRLGPQEGYDSYVEEEEGYDRCVVCGSGVWWVGACASILHVVWQCWQLCSA
jgi:hypothetical protein